MTLGCARTHCKKRCGQWTSAKNSERKHSFCGADAKVPKRTLAAGPTFAHSMTKTMLDQEWDMSLPAAIEAEAQAQAICMQTQDFERAYHAFLAKERPVFEGD